MYHAGVHSEKRRKSKKRSLGVSEMCIDSNRTADSNTSIEKDKPERDTGRNKIEVEEMKETRSEDTERLEETEKGENNTQVFEIVYANERDKRPHALVEVRGRKVLGLLDTGAQASVISEDSIDQLHLWADSIVETDRIISTADSTRHSAKGKLYIDFLFSGIKSRIPVLIGPIGKNRLILGIDFMLANGVHLDFLGQKYHISVNEVTIRKAQSYINALEAEENNILEEIGDPIDEEEMKLLNSEDVPKPVQHVTCPHILSVEQHRILEEVLKNFTRTPTEGILNCTTAISHNIDTGQANPVMRKQYPISPHMVKLARTEILRMVDRGIITRIEYSPWRQPMLIVGKKDGTGRICLDARELNKVTVANAFPIIDVNQILAQLRSTKYLSSIDLSQAFFQIPLDEDSQLKTAFVFDNQLYCYKRMTMGLKGSPSTLAVLVDRIFHNLKPHAFAYADDFIICSETFEEHMELLRVIAKRLDEFELTISDTKSSFVCQQLEFLGYLLNQEGLRANPDKIKPITEYPRPNTVKSMQRFLGMCGWYRRFIKDFARISAPLFDLIKTKTREIGWNESANESFEEMKEALTKAPILSMCDYGKPFKIWCDASLIAAGAVLTQEFEEEGEKVQKVIAYFSAKFSPQQRNYTTTERECLALILSIEKFRVYVEGAPFTIVTDHSALRWLMNTRDLKGRLARWAMRLQPFISDMSIVHRAGKDMQFPDALSRVYETAEIDIIMDGVGNGENMAEALARAYETAEIEIEAEKLEEVGSIAVELIECKAENTQDKWYLRMVQQTEKTDNSRYKVDNGILYHQNKFSPYSAERSWVICVPQDKREEVLKEQHDNMSHMGVWKTYRRMKTLYYWPDMCETIHQYIRRCDICRLAKPSNEGRKTKIGEYRDPIMPGRALSIDFTGPLPMSKNKNRFIFVAIDCFSRFIFAKAMRTATAEAVVEYLEKTIFAQNGCPEWIISDNGKQFKSQKFLDLCEKYKIRVETTPKGHPQANQVESTNKTLKDCLRTYTDVQKAHSNWELYLKKVIDEQNATPHSSTKQTPNLLHYGRELTRTGDEFRLLYDVNPDYVRSAERKDLILEEAQGIAHNQYDDRREKYNTRIKQRVFQENQRVFVSNWKLSSAGDKYSAKLANKKVEAFIAKKLGNDSYLLTDGNRKPIGKYHASKIMTR